MIGHDMLRVIDSVFGVPACALLSAVRRLLCASGVRTTPVVGRIRRVLFVQLAESGSMVLADPAMRAVVARTDSMPFCVTFARNRPSLSLTGTVPVENIFALRSDSFRTLFIDSVRLLFWVRRMRIDAVVDFELFSRLTAVMCLSTGVRARVGFHRFNGDGLYRGDLYSHAVAFNSRLHMAENYLLLAEALAQMSNGQIVDAKTIIGLLWLQNKLLLKGGK